MANEVIQYLADNSGCSFYRMKLPTMALQAKNPKCPVISNLNKYVFDENFYKGAKVIRIQRHVSNAQCEFILKFLRPIASSIGAWLIYEIDDVIGAEDIPNYNTGKAAYMTPGLMENITKIIEVCDFITVTTEQLGKYFVKKFRANPDKILVIPNYLPHWWIDGMYDIEKIKLKMKKNTPKRIGFISSSTHFDMANINGGQDDFTHINDFIRKNVDNYRFVLVGGFPRQLEDLISNRKVDFLPGFDIFNYPKVIGGLNLDLIIAPLADNIFNRCKSNIKFIETAAIGVPCYCQNIETYSKYTDMLFDNAVDLDEKVHKLFLNEDFYIDMVIKNRNFVDNNNGSWWLENNLHKWSKVLLEIPQRTLKINLMPKIQNPSSSEKVEVEVEVT